MHGHALHHRNTTDLHSNTTNQLSHNTYTSQQVRTCEGARGGSLAAEGPADLLVVAAGFFPVFFVGPAGFCLAGDVASVDSALHTWRQIA